MLLFFRQLRRKKPGQLGRRPIPLVSFFRFQLPCAPLSQRFHVIGFKRSGQPSLVAFGASGRKPAFLFVLGLLPYSSLARYHYIAKRVTCQGFSRKHDVIIGIFFLADFYAFPCVSGCMIRYLILPSRRLPRPGTDTIFCGITRKNPHF